MKAKRGLLIGVGALLVLAVAVGLAFASDASPTKEPSNSPFFDDTLQQAVNELDGRARPSGARRPAQQPTQHYTTEPGLWGQVCDFGYTRDLVQWPECHYTSDPQIWASCTPTMTWPTIDYTWDSTLWDQCDPTGAGITKDPGAVWCDPLWTADPGMGSQCVLSYTTDMQLWPWCHPRYTWDPAQWPTCPSVGPPFYTDNAGQWPECDAEYTTDPYLWAACHYTSDPQSTDCTSGFPTQDYTSNPQQWPECDPQFTWDPFAYPCEDSSYTQDPGQWPWCIVDPPYTSDPYLWPECHYTSDPNRWPECLARYPTKDYTWDWNIWPACDNFTQAPGQWPQCDPAYTQDEVRWPWCNPAWTWDPAIWLECEPGYTNDPGTWSECSEGLYTTQPATWPECNYPTADPRIWPECHYTSDPGTWTECSDTSWPTKDYTTDPNLWDECANDPAYTSDPLQWPECHYTSDPATWTECQPVYLGDLGDAPDSTNHAGATMTAYPAGGPLGTQANFPTVFDPATGLPPGPKHWSPRAMAWLGPWVTLENDADQMPDEDGVTNIEPPTDTPNRDGADDGLLYPVVLTDCQQTVISYTVTVTPSAPVMTYYVNVWFDWNRDGDWADVFTCSKRYDTPEWAVQNQAVALGPGTHVLTTTPFLPYNKTPGDPLWMRLSIADMEAPTNPATDLADGRGPDGGYELGETEDYYLQFEPDPDYDIYIKDNNTDDGSVPSSSPWWVSPDIWVRNDGNCANTTHENPTPGSSTTVCVRVRNRLTTTVTNINVDVYWANAALALSWPGSWSYINTFNVPSLAGGATIVKSVPWNVPFITGHFCLRALADANEDPLPSGPDTVAPVYNVQNNNNIGQKNTNIVDYPVVTECGVYTTTVYTKEVYFDAVNTWNTTKTVSIEFDSADFPLGTGTLIVEPGALWGRWSTLTNFNQIGATLVPLAFPATMGGILMGPFETARMTMTVAAEIDERFTIDIKEYVNSTEVGGIQYVRALPRCLYLPLVLKNYP